MTVATNVFHSRLELATKLFEYSRSPSVVNSFGNYPLTTGMIYGIIPVNGG